MDARRRLAANLLAEGRAYGYTLTVWGSGTMLVDAYGVPAPLGVLAFAAGALAAIAALAALAFDDPLDASATPPADERPVASLVHVAATFGNLAAVAGVVAAVGPRLPEPWAFLAVGALATVGYNGLLLAEEWVAAALS